MFFCRVLTVPANTSKAVPYSETMKVTAGTVKHVWIRWRYGEAGLCGSRLFYHEFQFWPMSLDEWIPSSYFPLDFAEGLEISTDPTEITIRAYNLDTRWPHKLWVAFEIEREKSESKLFGFINLPG